MALEPLVATPLAVGLLAFEERREAVLEDEFIEYRRVPNGSVRVRAMATTPAWASKPNPAPPSDAGSGSAQYESATFILCTALGSGIALRPGDPVGSKSGTWPAERPVAA